MPKTATKRPLSDAEKAEIKRREREAALRFLDTPDRIIRGVSAISDLGKGIVKEGLGALISGAEYAGDRKVQKDVPKDINRLGKMVAQNAGGYADMGNALYRLIKDDGKQSVPDYYRNKAGKAYQDTFKPEPADPRLERFGNFYADPIAVGFGASRAAKGLSDPKLYSKIVDELAQGTRLNAIDVWHGSPHKVDKFGAMDNIGNGQGGGSFGVGGYHASDAGVAKEYAPDGGYLYKNQLRWPDPAKEAKDPLSDSHFLDWDKPFDEQSDYVKSVVQGLDEDEWYRVLDNLGEDGDWSSGRNIYDMARLQFDSREDASRRLAGVGIPGIKFNDSDTIHRLGSNTPNYVTFDDNLVNILERNGQPVTAPQPGLLGKMVAPQDEALRVAQEAPPSIFREGRDGLFGGNMDYVARERFNIPALKKISSGGSDRDVYDLGNDHVLKVAKSARGLAQNDASDYYLSNAGILPEAIETGENYIVTRKMLPPDANTKKLVNGLKQFTHQDWRNNSDRLQQYLEDNNLSDILNYDVMHGDIAAIRNWGTTPDGLPIHLDEGTFNAGILDEFRGKTNMQNDDFRKVHAKSKAAKKKYGDKDKATMYGLLAPVGLGALIAQPKEKNKKP